MSDLVTCLGSKFSSPIYYLGNVEFILPPLRLPQVSQDRNVDLHALRARKRYNLIRSRGFPRVRDLGSSWKEGCPALVPLDSGSLTPENLHPVVHHFHSWCVCCQLEVSVTEQPKASESALKKWHPSVLSYNLLKVQFLRTKKTLCIRERSAPSFRRNYQWTISGVYQACGPRGPSFRWTQNQVDWQLNCIYRILSSLLFTRCWEGQTPLSNHISYFITQISYRLLKSVNSQSQLGILVPQLLLLDIYQKSTEKRARRKWGNPLMSHQSGVRKRGHPPKGQMACHSSALSCWTTSSYRRVSSSSSLTSH